MLVVKSQAGAATIYWAFSGAAAGQLLDLCWGILSILICCAVPVQCVGVLSKALGNAWKGPAASLIEPMILTGLSSTLVQSLQVEILQLLYLLSHAHAQCLHANQLVCGHLFIPR